MWNVKIIIIGNVCNVAIYRMVDYVLFMCCIYSLRSAYSNLDQRKEQNLPTNWR